MKVVLKGRMQSTSLDNGSCTIKIPRIKGTVDSTRGGPEAKVCTGEVTLVVRDLYTEDLCLGDVVDITIEIGGK